MICHLSVKFIGKFEHSVATKPSGVQRIKQKFSTEGWNYYKRRMCSVKKI